MPERRHDPQAKWFYEARFPGMDMRMSQNAIDPRMLVEAVGVDGRFEGSVRVFPGFGAESVHGVPAPEVGVTTIESIENIEFVKYVSIRKGTSPNSLRGLAMIGDNPDATGKALYFAYRDSDTGSSDVVMLEDFKEWTDFRPDTFEDYDISYLGRYAYFVNSGDVATDLTTFEDKALPYNKAYFWDFKVNDWDKYVGGLQGRIMGALPERCLATAINEVGDGVDVDDSEDALDNEGNGQTSNLANGEYTYGVELISRKHNLRSYIRWATFHLGSTGTTAMRYSINRTRLPDDQVGEVHQLRGNATTLTAPIHWGIGHVDGFRLWRSTLDDVGTPSDHVNGKYQVSQHLYVTYPYVEKDLYTNGSSTQTWEITLSNDGNDSGFPTEYDLDIISDAGLLTQEQYDAVFHEVGAAPRMKRIVGFDGMLIGVTDPREPLTPDEKWSDAERLPESFCWSAIHLNEPENFPVLNYEELDDPSERVLGLFAGSSAAFATTNMGIYRIVRAGTSLSITRIAYPIGCISRHSACMVGDTLYVVTRTGVKEIDGTTGEVRNVRLLNRLVFDRWASTLSSVRIGYDGFAGAILFLNTSTQELVLLWEATGAITRVVDAPWSYIATGPDVRTDNGGQRAFLVDQFGKTHTVDAYRESGKVTMFGAAGGDTVNGTVTDASATNIIDSTATFPTGCVGFKAYILSGDLAGETATIDTRNSATDLSVSGLSGSLEVGDRYSIAPVVVHVRFARLSGFGSDDPFVRKIAANLMASLSDLKGETSSSSTNAYVYMGLHSGSSEMVSSPVRISATPDEVKVQGNRARAKLFPFIASYGSNMDYEIDALLVQGQLSASEASSRQG